MDFYVSPLKFETVEISNGRLGRFGIFILAKAKPFLFLSFFVDIELEVHHRSHEFENFQNFGLSGIVRDVPHVDLFVFGGSF